jgi:hypothetical protein
MEQSTSQGIPGDVHEAHLPPIDAGAGGVDLERLRVGGWGWGGGGGGEGELGYVHSESAAELPKVSSPHDSLICVELRTRAACHSTMFCVDHHPAM